MRRQKFKIWDNKNKCWYKPIYEAYRGKLEYLMLSPEGDLSMVTMNGIAHESTFKDRFDVIFIEDEHTVGKDNLLCNIIYN